MKGRKATVEEDNHMKKVRDLGCIVCFDAFQVMTPAAIHHIDGKTKPGAHFHVLPLCGKHHQEKDNKKPKLWFSRHGDGRKAFEEAYGTEQELLHKVLELIGE